MQYQQQHQQQPTHYTSQFDQYQNNYAYSQAPATANNAESSRLMSPKFENDSADNDSPMLRALLNNKSAERLSPCYSNQSPPAKRSRTLQNNYVENGTISPVRTEDSLDFTLYDFTFENQQPIFEKSGYEHGAMPLGMTGENLVAASSTSSTPLTTHTVSSPITNTPPQSPGEAAIQMSLNSLDASFKTDSNAHTQNGDGKCRIIFI